MQVIGLKKAEFEVYNKDTRYRTYLRGHGKVFKIQGFTEYKIEDTGHEKNVSYIIRETEIRLKI
jgi:hypothetical protein